MSAVRGTGPRAFGLLLSGAAPRLAAVAVIVALLWAGYFWVIATPGAL
ncbi:MAG: hypothetical protein AAF092_15720 [Pseudomonadota bacterium]